MKGDDLCFLGIRELRSRYQRREVSPLEVVRAVVERIDRFGVRLNAWVTICRESALSEAADAERALRRGHDLGVLHGIPVSVKDNIDTAGVRTTRGSPLFANRIPGQDATVVERLREAGAIVLGKTNLLEFAYGVVHPDFGQCNNPWDLTRTSGGSSSGSAAVVASGMGCASLGTDTGGSIRVPAAYCGVVGFKPSYGRVSRYGVFPLSWSLDHVGPLTRTVEDAAVVFSVIGGHDVSDPSTITLPTLKALSYDDADLAGTRIGIVSELLGDEVQRGVGAAFEAALDVFRKAGAILRDVSIPAIQYGDEALTAVVASEAASVHEGLLRDHPERYSEKARLQLEVGSMYPAIGYIRAQRFRALLMSEFDAAFSDVDIIVSSTTPTVAPADNPHPGLAVREKTKTVRRTGPFNLAGLPAVSVPCGIGDDGLPVGLQIAGPWLEDNRVLLSALAFEVSLGWKPECPPGVRSPVEES